MNKVAKKCVRLRNMRPLRVAECVVIKANNRLTGAVFGLFILLM